MAKEFTLGIIGGGFMAHAIAQGAVRSGFLSPERIAIGEPDSERANALRNEGFFIAGGNGEVAENCDYLLFAVKPQIFPVVAQELSSRPLPVLLTIMAGRTKENIRRSLGGTSSPIARAMPNLPCSVGAGAIGIDVSELQQSQRAFALGLFSSVGKVAEVREEQLNAVTGVSGSGPAYVFLFLKSLIEAGIKEGLTEEQAKTLAFQTALGGVKLASEAEKSLDELIGAVSSKGGTTVAALEQFEKDGFRGAVSRAVEAAVKRAEELSK